MGELFERGVDAPAAGDLAAVSDEALVREIQAAAQDALAAAEAARSGGTSARPWDVLSEDEYAVFAAMRDRLAALPSDAGVATVVAAVERVLNPWWPVETVRESVERLRYAAMRLPQEVQTERLFSRESSTRPGSASSGRSPASRVLGARRPDTTGVEYS
ncbi:MAG: hypothetical protein ACRDT6_18655 [Micromonosporaceae bacterium]